MGNDLTRTHGGWSGCRTIPAKSSDMLTYHKAHNREVSRGDAVRRNGSPLINTTIPIARVGGRGRGRDPERGKCPLEQMVEDDMAEWGNRTSN
jgi:hypothetical protein